ncbi:chromosomal replication initiator DnaA [Algirhabdus cladophorae]|uniref:chromosomal replication initiator DnaA n=1 Tax=Algirhabdus cladophorae TaxID=3377108 RepID=UPI003B848A9A
MNTQLTFDLPSVPALGRDAFFVSPSNHVALALLEKPGNWSNRKMLLCGPAKSGKTHLAHVWAEQTGAQVFAAKDVTLDSVAGIAQKAFVVIEDLHEAAGDPDAETALFHAHNLILAEGGTLLLTGTDEPSVWPIALPDLASRVQGTALAQLLAPDDQLLAMVMVKQFADRQLTPPAKVLTYLTTHMERSFAHATALVDEMDRIALRTRKPLNRTVAAQALDKLAAAQA